MKALGWAIGLTIYAVALWLTSRLAAYIDGRRTSAHHVDGDPR